MPGENRISATETAFGILDVVHRYQGATAEEITEATDLSRAGVYKHLRTLVAVDALENRDGVYALGPKFTEYGLENSESRFVLDQSDKIDQLSHSLDAPINLWIAEDSDCRCVYTTGSDGRGDYPRRRGDSVPLTESPPGKAILAHLPEDRRDELTDGRDRSLSDQLEGLKERQFLEEPLDDDDPEWVAISTPVLDPSDRPVAAIEIVVSSERASGIDVKNNIRGLLTETAHQIRVEML
ncbi:IclR family transcriptional regulator [Halosimplex sp. TS25]|uniref:IclR family transcriptional regulator n=1 Tax=Halosimplex rarum TaxID=3396619 RepID=UPI0039E7ABC0